MLVIVLHIRGTKINKIHSVFTYYLCIIPLSLTIGVDAGHEGSEDKGHQPRLEKGSKN